MASALSAPTENTKPVVEVKEVKTAVVEPQARALAIGATPYQPYQHQFGARITPYYQTQPQHQYLVGQQHAYNYIHADPTQVQISRTGYQNNKQINAQKYSWISQFSQRVVLKFLSQWWALLKNLY